MTGDEGSKVQNKSDWETNNQLIKKKSYVWRIMLLRSLASGDRYLWSHQSQGATKAWFSLLPNCSLALDGVKNWDIEALSGDNLFLSILECVTCPWGGISQKNCTEASQWAIFTLTLASPLNLALKSFCHFLPLSQDSDPYNLPQCQIFWTSALDPYRVFIVKKKKVVLSLTQ